MTRYRPAAGIARERSIQVRLSDSEYQKIEDRATDAGKSKSWFMVEAALNSAPPARTSLLVTELFGLRRQLAAVNGQPSQIPAILDRLDSFLDTLGAQS